MRQPICPEARRPQTLGCTYDTRFFLFCFVFFVFCFFFSNFYSVSFLSQKREREKEKTTRKRGQGGRDRIRSRSPCCQILLLCIPPKVHTLSFYIAATARSLSSRLLTYHNLIPSFLLTTMSDIPDIILKNSDQRTLSPKAVAFQVATMAGISVCCPPPA